MTKHVLLTGGAGFIGHHMVAEILEKTNWRLTILDSLTYAADLSRLAYLPARMHNLGRLQYVFHDFGASLNQNVRSRIKGMGGNPDVIIHMGGETHVDRSINDPYPFIRSNVLGTVNMLEYAKSIGVSRFIYVSTDEVYGPVVGDQLHKEGEAHRPSNPYSASKSGAEQFCYAYWNTYGLPIVVTNTMNNFGEGQDGEKFVPKALLRILKNEPVPLHCKFDENGGLQDISSRCWLYARNHCAALRFLVDRGEPGEHYNIVGEKYNVFEVAKMIARAAVAYDGKPYGLTPAFEDFHSFRPGHDMHYGLDGSKLKRMGFEYPYDFETTMKATVRWYMQNPRLLDPELNAK